MFNTLAHSYTSGGHNKGRMTELIQALVKSASSATNTNFIRDESTEVLEQSI